MSGLFRFDFYPNIWLSGTHGLSDRARGVYIDLLARMYDLGCPLDNDTKELCRFLRYRDYRQLTPVLKELVDSGKIIVTDDGKLTNERFEIELEKAEARIKNSGKGGRAKARNPRKKVTKPVPEGDQQATSGQSQDPSFVGKQPLNSCPLPLPSPEEELSKESGLAAYWRFAPALAEKAGKPEKAVRAIMGQLKNNFDGDFDRAMRVITQAIEKNDPFTYITATIHRIKNPTPKATTPTVNGPCPLSHGEAEYLDSLDLTNLTPEETAFIESIDARWFE